MRITMAAEYAVRCVIYLAQKGPGVLTTRQEVAERADIPAKFLSKIAQDLAKSDIIDIKQGAKGGYSLRHRPEDINMLTVVEAIIGTISLNECTTRPGVCPSSPTCSANRVWMAARDQVRETLRRATFADLAAKGACCGPPPDLTNLAGDRS